MFSDPGFGGAAVVGGTSSKIGGGKFENGAITAAFARLFNHEKEGIKKAANIAGGAVELGLGASGMAVSGFALTVALASNPVGWVVAAGWAGAFVLSSVTVFDGFTRLRNAVSNEDRPEFLETAGYAIDGENGAQVGARIDNVMDIMNIGRSGANAVSNSGKVIDYLEFGADVNAVVNE